MKYLIGVGYVNRTDLLDRALLSIKPFWPNTTIIDNSANRELKGKYSYVKTYEPPVPLSFSQSMNLLQKMAQYEGCDIVMFMHNDAEAHPGVADAFLGKLEMLSHLGQKWGVAFTNYHTLVAFNMNAVREVGGWDTTLPRYFADCDYYRRMELAGYPPVHTGLQVTHHNDGSSTIKSDPYLNLLNGVTFPLYMDYYAAKWGGLPGQETYLSPFNLGPNFVTPLNLGPNSDAVNLKDTGTNEHKGTGMRAKKKEKPGRGH